MIVGRNQDHYTSLYSDDPFIDRMNIEAKKIRDKLQDIPYDKTKKVLDVACGASLFSTFFSSQAYGIDLNKQSISFAKKHGIKAQVGDVEGPWNFPDGFFDIVLASQIIEHLVNTDHLILEAKRVLKKNGLLVVVTPNLAAWYNRLLLLVGYQPFFTEVSTYDKTFGLSFTRAMTPQREPFGHLRLFTPGALKELIAYHGFSVIKLTGSDVTFFPSYIGIIDKILSFIPQLSSNMAVVGKKI